MKSKSIYHNCRVYGFVFSIFGDSACVLLDEAVLLFLELSCLLHMYMCVIVKDHVCVCLIAFRLAS